jgi:Matrixin/PEP-CTERM motif
MRFSVHRPCSRQSHASWSCDGRQRIPSAFVLLFCGFLGALAAGPRAALADYVTFGNGYGSKWDEPTFGFPATITWGFMPDGTTITPTEAFSEVVIGGSKISQMRSNFDTQFGAGAFDTAIQNALNTWQAVANITFVGPITDPSQGMPLASGAPGATTPDIRIGAFDPVPGSWFSFAAGVGWGPPGDDLHFPDAFAGDIMFNLAQTFVRSAGNEDDPISPIGANDLEGLALHELGHAAIGLGHPDHGPGDVMYVGSDGVGFINRQLSPDDIAGAVEVYGPPNPLPGDANYDGAVNIFDINLVSSHWNESGPTGDANGDMAVNIFDINLISSNWTSGGSGTAVPEPGSFILAGIALAGIMARGGSAPSGRARSRIAGSRGRNKGCRSDR